MSIVRLTLEQLELCRDVLTEWVNDLPNEGWPGEAKTDKTIASISWLILEEKRRVKREQDQSGQEVCNKP